MLRPKPPVASRAASPSETISVAAWEQWSNFGTRTGPRSGLGNRMAKLTDQHGPRSEHSNSATDTLLLAVMDVRDDKGGRGGAVVLDPMRARSELGECLARTKLLGS